MSENQTTIKAEEKKKLKDQARNFLDSRFFYAAVDMYKRVLAIDPEDRDSHLGVLMGNALVNSEEELIAFYQGLYPDSQAEKKFACEKDEKTISRICDTYWLEGYLSKEEIRRNCRFDLSYDSHLSSRIRQKYEFCDLISKDEHLSYLEKNEPEFINRIMAAFDKRINEAKREDELNVSLIKEEYDGFLKEMENKVKVLNIEAKEKRDHDLNVLSEKYDRSQEIEELRELIEQFEAFKDFDEAKQYAKLCQDKINQLIEKKNNKPSVSRMSELLSYARKALAEGRFSDAYDAFMDISTSYPQSEEAHLGLLMAKRKVKNEKDLFDYYKNLYNEDRYEIIEACEEDKYHIEEMARKYTLPGYLEKEEILEAYVFDRSCKSSFSHRLEEQKEFENEAASDVSFRFLELNGSEKVKEEIASIYHAYQNRADTAREEERKNKEEVGNAYHRFLFSTYSSLRNRYQDALNQKDEDYKKLIRKIDDCEDERKLNELLGELQDFGDYKDIQNYISLCKKRIGLIKEKKEADQRQKELETRLEEGKKTLKRGDFSLAWRLFSSILSDFKDVPYAQLGLVMSQLSLKDEEKFSNYYKYLFSDVKTEKLEACEENSEFIDEMCYKFEIPGYLEKDKIRSYFKIDRSFASETTNRIEQRRQIEEEFTMNPYLSKARENADDHIKAVFDDILSAYDERIKEAQKTDELKCNSIKDIYQYYLKQSMRTVVTLYKQKIKERDENNERRYRENVQKFNSDLSLEELKELISSFDKDYEDGAYYIEECKKRLAVLETEKQKSDYAFNYESGIRCLKERHFNEAKQYFDDCLSLKPESEENHINCLLADHGVLNTEELFNYYKSLFDEKIYVPKIAVKENREHIDQIFRKYYTIPEYVERDVIKEKYQFDRTYMSLSECRERQKQQIENLIENEKSLSWLSKNGSDSIKEKIKDLLNTYENRIVEARKADERAIEKVKESYGKFLTEKDKEVRSLYQGLIRKKDSIEAKMEPKEEQKSKSLSLTSLAKKEEKPVIKTEKKEEKVKKPKTAGWKLFITFGVLAALLALGTFYYLNNNQESRRYEEAMKLAEAGKYEEAIAIFEQLGDYKESVYYTKQMTYQKADHLYKEGNYYEAIALFRNLRFDDSEERANSIQKELISKAKVQDFVFFGSYEQDGNIANGNEPIEWIVLEKQNGKILLLSRYGLDVQRYSDQTDEASWENSLIRTWLNGTFMDDAFNKEDLNEILQTTLLNSPNIEGKENEEVSEEVDPDGKQTISLQKTRDRVFLLNDQELETYLPEGGSRKCSIGAYVSEKGVKNNEVSWWLRSNDAEKAGTAQAVSGSDGSIEDLIVESQSVVRPAVWVKTY